VGLISFQGANESRRRGGGKGKLRGRKVGGKFEKSPVKVHVLCLSKRKGTPTLVQGGQRFEEIRTTTKVPMPLQRYPSPPIKAKEKN